MMEGVGLPPKTRGRHHLAQGRGSSCMTMTGWDAAYESSTPAPWDIGRPQPAFVRLADSGLLGGQLLDAGCGTGEHTLLAAAHGADATGVDISPRAIGRAREKAAARGLAVRFDVANALDLAQLGRTFDTVLDSGLFHVFDDQDRPRYVTSLGSALQPGGTCFLMCFSDRQPGDFGPRRVRRDELAAAFSDGWNVTSIAADTFEINPGLGTTIAQAWLATIRRL
jgi:SAM-dependent methyltransferase